MTLFLSVKLALSEIVAIESLFLTVVSLNLSIPTLYLLITTNFILIVTISFLRHCIFRLWLHISHFISLDCYFILSICNFIPPSCGFISVTTYLPILTLFLVIATYYFKLTQLAFNFFLWFGNRLPYFCLAKTNKSIFLLPTTHFFDGPEHCILLLGPSISFQSKLDYLTLTQHKQTNNFISILTFWIGCLDFQTLSQPINTCHP